MGLKHRIICHLRPVVSASFFQAATPLRFIRLRNTIFGEVKLITRSDYASAWVFSITHLFRMNAA